MFHKGEYVGHLEPAVMDNNTIDQTETHQTNSITLKKMMVETVTPDTFNPPCHELPTTIPNELELLLWEYESQFAKDETSIWNHSSYQHDDRYRYLQPHLSKTLPHNYEALPMGKR